MADNKTSYEIVIMGKVIEDYNKLVDVSKQLVRSEFYSAYNEGGRVKRDLAIIKNAQILATLMLNQNLMTKGVKDLYVRRRPIIQNGD